jgi:uncharacterized membrane protein YvbJ
MSILKCTECGCAIPPDLSKCPSCGHKYTEARVKATANTSGNGGITMGRIGYSIKCEIHGKIHITASVASPPTRCPFC